MIPNLSANTNHYFRFLRHHRQYYIVHILISRAICRLSEKYHQIIGVLGWAVPSVLTFIGTAAQ